MLSLTIAWFYADDGWCCRGWELSPDRRGFGHLFQPKRGAGSSWKQWMSLLGKAALPRVAMSPPSPIPVGCCKPSANPPQAGQQQHPLPAQPSSGGGAAPLHPPSPSTLLSILFSIPPILHPRNISRSSPPLLLPGH